MGNDGGEADPQHPSGIPHSGAVHRHINNLIRYPRFVGFIQVIQLKTMVAIAAAVTLEATACFAMTVDPFALTGRTLD